MAMWGKRPDNAGESDFRRRVEAMSERAWNAAQTVGGLLLGGAVSFFLIGGNEDDSFSFFTVYALVLALLVPRILEQLCGRSVNRGRIAMVAAIAVIMVVQLAFAGWKGL